MNVNQLNFEKIIKVVQVDNPDVVNSYLDIGWILINVHTTDSGHPVERHQGTRFTLGWDGGNGEVQHPPKTQYENLLF